MSRQGCLLIAGLLLSAVFFTGCASGRKQKLEQREKLAASSGLYCDFVNGEKNKEVELELNMVMSRKCDADRPFSITNYKTPSEVTGMMYCCATKRPEAPRTAKSEVQRVEQPPAPAAPKPAIPAVPKAAPAPAPEAPKTDLDEGAAL